MKNLHGIEPTRFIKKNDNNAIYCDPSYGPFFGSGADICIYDNCNEKGGYTNYGYGSYECSSPLKCSLFMGTVGPNPTKYFKVSDYEVFTYK